ncbi:MAG: rhomboid family intramembrane serine protease [Sphingobacteriales bacterium]|jgi:membrane associated rhomboid family serine protease|nr:rhomboid family intramembrane serine protease [Sphingobacteriales bacterium]MBP9140265.1 rhomboid family intramembrane serine protease [Chitinophagales bacterium]MDA0197208.1 rhomboid family intramembrane serine protease [Bacteroidota bacterium]MBK6891453.1 rhomboid family intramembrane serine protease [Sphingobacteriales bacterium]MBK7526715.1 rhomboid family intramembrane serine protease [Sphingobacteriales bacterium]
MLTTLIIGVTVLVSVLAFNNRNLFEKLLFSPFLVKKNNEYSRFITSGFIHANFMHLAFNMLTLYFMGKYVEVFFKVQFGVAVGSLLYVGMYLLALIAADLPDFSRHQNNPYYRSLGASGAVSGVLFASILLAPLSKLIIFPIPIPIPAVLFGVLYLVYSAWASRNANDNIGHSAHFFGALFGILFMLMVYPGIVRHFLNELGI